MPLSLQAPGEHLHGGSLLPCKFVPRDDDLAIAGGAAPVSGGYYPLYTYAQSGTQQTLPLRPMSPQQISPLDADPLIPLNRLQYPFGPTRQGHYPMATFVNRSQSNSRNASRAATPNPHSHSNSNAHATLSRRGSGGVSKGSPSEGNTGPDICPPVSSLPAPIEVVVTSSGSAEQEKASQGTNSSNGSGALALLGCADVRPPPESFVVEAATTSYAAGAGLPLPLPSLACVPALPPMPPVPALPGASSAVVGRRPITPRQNADSQVLLQTQPLLHPTVSSGSARPSGGPPPVAPKPTIGANDPIPCRVRSPVPIGSSAIANGPSAGMSKWFDRLNGASQV